MEDACQWLGVEKMAQIPSSLGSRGFCVRDSSWCLSGSSRACLEKQCMMAAGVTAVFYAGTGAVLLRAA